MFPLPFTFAFAVLFAAFLISKLQYKHTYIKIALYSILGPMEEATLILSFYRFTQNDDNFTFKVLLLSSLSIIAFLNILAYLMQTKILKADKHFIKWSKKKLKEQDCSSNQLWFYVISWISILASYKFKMILFSRVFNLDVMKCQLQSKQKFKIFDLMSLIGLISQIVALYCCINIIASFGNLQTDILIFVDSIVILALNILFSVLIVKKDAQFFQQQIDGVQINKIYNVGEEQFQSGIGLQSAFSKQFLFLPEIIQQDQYVYTMESKRRKKIKQLQKQPVLIKQRQQQSNSSSSSIMGKYSEEKTDNASYAGQVQAAPNVDEVIRQYDNITAEIQENGNIFEINEQFGKQEQSSKNQSLLNEENLQVRGQLKSQIPIQLELPDQSSHFQFQYPIKQQNANNNLNDIIKKVQNQHSPNRQSIQRRKNMEKWKNKNKQTIKTHTKLSDYLNHFSKYQQNQNEMGKKMQLIKYDYIDNNDKLNQFAEQKQQKFKINQGQLIDSEYSQRYQIQNPIIQHLKIIQTKNIISLSKQTKDHHIQQNYHEGTIQYKNQQHYWPKQLFHRPQTSRTSPKKVILKDQQHKVYINKSSLFRCQLNENHAQNPIRNKSKQKLIAHNHPIKSVQSSHPLRSRTQIPAQSRDKELDLQSSDKTYSKFINNFQQGIKSFSHIGKFHNKTQQHLAKRIDNVNHKTQQIKRKTLEQGEQQQYQLKTQFYEKYLKNQVQSSRIFKRTINTAKTLFPHKNTKENLLSDQSQFHKDQVPRKPIQSFHEHVKPISTSPSDSNRKPSKPTIIKFTAKYSSLDKSKMGGQVNRRKHSMRRKSSLQKIYLQNLQKMIQNNG